MRLRCSAQAPCGNYSPSQPLPSLEARKEAPATSSHCPKCPEPYLTSIFKRIPSLFIIFLVGQTPNSSLSFSDSVALRFSKHSLVFVNSFVQSFLIFVSAVELST